MSILHRYSPVWALGVSLSMSACFMQPCGEPSAVVGTWEVATINGQAIPANGFQLPGSSERLRQGTLYFGEKYNQCEGDKLALTRGEVIADYTLLTSAGAAKESETYAGSYEHVVTTNVVELSANGETVTGARTVNGNLSFSGTLPSLGGQTVVFRRIK